MTRKWQEFLHRPFEVYYQMKTLLMGPNYPLHRSEPYRPFFIVGAGRSGTTLLRRILQVSPEIHIPPENHALANAIKVYRYYRNMPWEHLVHLVLAMFEFCPTFDTFEISLRPLANQLVNAPGESRSLAFILDSLYRYHGEQTGQTFERWGDKTPLNSYSMEPILSVFPHAQFIHILRDGVDVIISAVKSLPQSWDIPGMAIRWKTSIEAIQSFARKHPDICYEIRYEKLVADPDGVVKPLCRFLDVKFDASMLESFDHVGNMGDVPRRAHHANVLKPLTKDYVGKGRKELSNEQKMKLQQLIGDDLIRLGYDPVV